MKLAIFKEDAQLSRSYQDPETLTSISSVSLAMETVKADPPIQEPKDFAMEEAAVSLADSMLCDSGSRLIPTGLTRSDSTG